MSPFYNPMMSRPDIFGGIGNFLNQMMMLKLIQQMYPGEGKETIGETPLPGGKEMEKTFERDIGGKNIVADIMSKFGTTPQGGQQLPPGLNLAPFLGATGMPTQEPTQFFSGQPPIGQTPLPPQGNVPQMLQMLGGLPGLMR